MKICLTDIKVFGSLFVCLTFLILLCLNCIKRKKDVGLETHCTIVCIMHMTKTTVVAIRYKELSEYLCKCSFLLLIDKSAFKHAFVYFTD